MNACWRFCAVAGLLHATAVLAQAELRDPTQLPAVLRAPPAGAAPLPGLPGSPGSSAAPGAPGVPGAPGTIPEAAFQHIVMVNGRAFLVIAGRRLGVGDRLGSARITRIEDSAVWLKEAGVTKRQGLFNGIEKNVEKPILKNEPNVLIINSPLCVFGDIHGQFSDMIHFLEMTGLPPNNKFLFMGDYVDRGNNSIEVCALLFAMKIMFPDSIQILRGNHECPEINSLYGLLNECESRFGNDARMVFNKINEVLCVLPLCAIISNKIFCVHGGISPHLKTIEDITKINRFCIIPDKGLLCDMMWADPSQTVTEWGISVRGIGCTYNNTAIARFLKNNKLQLLCRAHQLVSEGYKFAANNKLITVFSAPNYCGNCGNDGSVMKVSSDLVCSFIIIKPTNEKKESQTELKKQKEFKTKTGIFCA